MKKDMTARIHEIFGHHPGEVRATNYPKEDLVGKFFGRWEVLEFVPSTEKDLWLCECACDNVRRIPTHQLTSGDSKSCGCLRNEMNKDPDKVSRIRKKLRKSPGKSGLTYLVSRYKHGAINRGLVWGLTREQVQSLTQGNCAYCGVPPSFDSSPFSRSNTSKGHSTYTYNGIDRVDNTLGYTPDNCVTACGHCNFAKRIRTATEYKEWIRRSYEHLFSTKIPQA